MTPFVKTQTVVILSDLLQVQEPVRWTIAQPSGGLSWAQSQLDLQAALLEAAQTVLDWRRDDDSPDSVADFARQVAMCAPGPNWSLRGSACTLVVTSEPAP